MPRRKGRERPQQLLSITANRQRADTARKLIRDCVPELDRGLFLIADRAPHLQGGRGRGARGRGKPSYKKVMWSQARPAYEPSGLLAALRGSSGTHPRMPVLADE